MAGDDGWLVTMEAPMFALAAEGSTRWQLAGMFVLMLAVGALGIASLVWYARHR